jgi:TrmH family RNA methyltransferase
MKRISSRQNPLFKRIREAIRDHAEEIVIEGPKPVADAIANGWKPIEVITRDIEFSAELFDALTETKHPQDVIGLFERPRTRASEILARRDSIAIALDAVQDPGNVGTIVRLAAAFDASGVLLLPGCADAFGPKAIRSSAGAILNVPVANVTARELLDCGVPLIVTAMNGATIAPPSREAVLVFGNEGAGVSEELMRASKSIAIPMSGRVESLNVAASAAILLSRSFSARTVNGE